MQEKKHLYSLKPSTLKLKHQSFRYLGFRQKPGSFTIQICIAFSWDGSGISRAKFIFKNKWNGFAYIFYMFDHMIICQLKKDKEVQEAEMLLALKLQPTCMMNPY